MTNHILDTFHSHIENGGVLFEAVEIETEGDFDYSMEVGLSNYTTHCTFQFSLGDERHVNRMIEMLEKVKARMLKTGVKNCFIESPE